MYEEKECLIGEEKDLYGRGKEKTYGWGKGYKGKHW